MSQHDQRLDVPAMAFINAQLIAVLERGATLLEAKKYVFAQPYYSAYDLDVYKWTLNNPAHALALLYCTVAVPREILDLPRNHALYRALDTARVTELFEIRKPANCDAFSLVRGLRHAVAHALFSIRDEQGAPRYTFWNDGHEFEVEVSHLALLGAIERVGTALANAVLRQRPGDSSGR